jgi:hypothetical protein
MSIYLYLYWENKIIIFYTLNGNGVSALQVTGALTVLPVPLLSVSFVGSVVDNNNNFESGIGDIGYWGGVKFEVYFAVPFTQ